MIHNKFRYLLTLVALFAMTAGVWAQTEELLTTITATGKTTYSATTEGVVDVELAGVDAFTKNAWEWNYDNGYIKVTPKDGYNVTKCVFKFGAQSITVSNSPYEIQYSYPSFAGSSLYDINVIEVYGTTEPPIVVEPVAGKTNEWTFIQPGSDVVLTPIYSAATISHAAGTPEASETAFETLKEAFANVQDGDVIKLDWDVTLTEHLATPSDGDGVKFTLDFNGYTIDGGTTYQIVLYNAGDQLTFTDSSDDQLGGLIAKDLLPVAGSEFVFVAGRYNLNGATAETINGVCADSSIPLSLAEGKEFVDLEGGAEANDGFTVRVDYKAIELTIGAGKFATFYMDQNITLADGTDANIGLYTIDGEGINLANNTVTVTKVNDPIAIAGMPLLVYNGTTEQKTVTLKVTPVAPTAGQMWSSHFQGTAVDKTFDADDMAANDYYVLSGGKAFAPVYGAGTIAAHKCWLQFDHETNGSAPARQLTIVFDETTGVNEVIEVNEVSDDTLYDLNGRKLNGIPTKKGVYILNGRKVVIK